MPGPFGLPRPPGLPPLPRLARKESAHIPEIIPAPADAPAKPPRDPAELGLVMKRRGPDPSAWLKPHQARLAEASRIAGEQTKHLKGPARDVAKYRIVGKLLARHE